MNKRINIQDLEPKAYRGMLALESFLNSCGLSKTHLHLIKIRASQMNGCAYCINMHTQDALKDGETAARLFLLDAWRETESYSSEERIILAITEEVTFIHKHGLSDKTYDEAKKIFDDNYIAQIIMAVVSINGWNRLAISTQKLPE